MNSHNHNNEKISSFDFLPDEILLKIFEFMELETAIQVMRVCKRFKYVMPKIVIKTSCMEFGIYLAWLESQSKQLEEGLIVFERKMRKINALCDENVYGTYTHDTLLSALPVSVVLSYDTPFHQSTLINLFFTGIIVYLFLRLFHLVADQLQREIAMYRHIVSDKELAWQFAKKYQLILLNEPIADLSTEKFLQIFEHNHLYLFLLFGYAKTRISVIKEYIEILWELSVKSRNTKSCVEIYYQDLKIKESGLPKFTAYTFIMWKKLRAQPATKLENTMANPTLR